MPAAPGPAPREPYSNRPDSVGGRLPGRRPIPRQLQVVDVRPVLTGEFDSRPEDVGVDVLALRMGLEVPDDAEQHVVVVSVPGGAPEVALGFVLVAELLERRREVFGELDDGPEIQEAVSVAPAAGGVRRDVPAFTHGAGRPFRDGFSRQRRRVVVGVFGPRPFGCDGVGPVGPARECPDAMRDRGFAMPQPETVRTDAGVVFDVVEDARLVVIVGVGRIGHDGGT